MTHEEGPDTLHTCEACQGQGCPWCDQGLQSRAQFARWSAFRQGMPKLSGTYDLMEATVLDILGRLNLDGSRLALLLESEGRVLLDMWHHTNPTNGGRGEVSSELKAFNKKALDYLQAR